MSAVERQDKSVLRQKFKSVRSELSKAQGADLRALLNRNVRRLLQDYPEAEVLAYRPLADEAPLEMDPADGFFPRVQGQDLEFYRPRSAADFQPGPFSISEPRPDCSERWQPSKPTVALCPAVAVDRRGVRLGQGKGFYDRFFASHPEVIRVGVVFHDQISATDLPEEEGDQRLNWIVSEKMIISANFRRM